MEHRNERTLLNTLMKYLGILYRIINHIHINYTITNMQQKIKETFLNAVRFIKAQNNKCLPNSNISITK